MTDSGTRPGPAITDGQPHRFTPHGLTGVASALTKLLTNLYEQYGEAQLTNTSAFGMHTRRLLPNTKVVIGNADAIVLHGVDAAAESDGADAILIHNIDPAGRPPASEVDAVHEMIVTGIDFAFYSISPIQAVLVGGSDTSRQTIVIGPPPWPFM